MEKLPERENAGEVKFSDLTRIVGREFGANLPDFDDVDLEEKLERLQQEVLDAEIERQGRKEVFALRNKWSDILIRLITLMIVSQLALVILVGSGQLHFEDYKEFLFLIASQNFLQILGLAAIVVKYAFSDKNKLR